MIRTWLTELSWAAGFFDGEGWVGVVDTPKQTRPPFARLSVIQADRRVLDRFRDAVGVGRVFGPYRNYGGPDRKPRYDFSAVHLPQVQAIVAMLWAFLSPVKREQAKTALIAARDTARARPGRGLFRKLCKNGHDLTSIPVRMQAGRRVRVCLACRAGYMRSRRAEQKMAAALLEA